MPALRINPADLIPNPGARERIEAAGRQFAAMEAARHHTPQAMQVPPPRTAPVVTLPPKKRNAQSGPEQRSKPITMGLCSVSRAIVVAEAKASRLTVAIILGNRRIRRVVAARHNAVAAVYLAKPEYSIARIGRMFGMDHTSVLHILRKRGLK